MKTLSPDLGERAIKKAMKINLHRLFYCLDFVRLIDYVVETGSARIGRLNTSAAP